MTVRWWVEWQLCLRHSLRPGESRGQLFHSPSWVERSRVFITVFCVLIFIVVVIRVYVAVVVVVVVNGSGLLNTVNFAA